MRYRAGYLPLRSGEAIPGISAGGQLDNKAEGWNGSRLAISKRIIEMHGGRIWVESEIGNGAKFTFTVPVRAQRQVANDG